MDIWSRFRLQLYLPSFVLVRDYGQLSPAAHFFYLLKSFHAVAATSGTCPFPMALSLSIASAIPLTIRQILGSVFQLFLLNPSMLDLKGIERDGLMALLEPNWALFPLFRPMRLELDIFATIQILFRR